MPRAAPSPSDTPAAAASAPRWRRAAGGVAAVVVLGLVFAMYWQPETVIGLATQLWSCL